MRLSAAPLAALFLIATGTLDAGARRPAGPWKTLPPMPTARFMAAGAVLDGRFYVIGGAALHGTTPTAAVEAFDPRSGSWTKKRPMNVARTQPAVGVIDGRLYAAGGDFGGSSYSDVLEIYDPKTDRWTMRSPMPSRRIGYGTAVGGLFYVMGGVMPGRCLATAEAYDPATDRWSELPMMPSVRCHANVVTVDGRIFVVGGTDTSGRIKYQTIEVFDPATRVWSSATVAPMPTGRQYVSPGVGAGSLFAVGGHIARPDGQTVTVATLEVLDLKSGVWSVRTPMPTARAGMAAGVFDGIFYVAGGTIQEAGPDPLNTLEAYDPRKDPVSSSPAPAAVQAQLAAPPPTAPSSDVDLFSGKTAARPDDFALIMGIDSYRELPAARFAARDARTFKRYAQTVLGVPEENIILLEGEKAARTDITKYIEEWLPRNIEKDSTVYVYYSGHGAPEPSKGTAFLVPWDGDPQFLETTAYPLERLYQKLGALNAKHVVVMLDSCFSGLGGRSVLGKNLRPLVTVIDVPAPVSLLKHGRLSILTAAGGDEVAGGLEDQQHGLFTYYLLKGLKDAEADANHDGHVDISELYDYVRKNVRRRAHRENREQNPHLQTSEPGLALY